MSDATTETTVIADLTDHPAAIPVLARWGLGQWAELFPEDTLATYLEYFEMQRAAGGIPFALVALIDRPGQGEPKCVGSASVVEADDLDGFEHLTPWLASVYVNPSQRGRGVGARLVAATCRRAAALGVTNLHLWTEDRRDWYRAMGWHVHASSRFRRRTIDVLCRSLADLQADDAESLAGPANLTGHVDRAPNPQA